MSEFFSTIIDPFNFGIGKAITGSSSFLETGKHTGGPDNKQQVNQPAAPNPADAQKAALDKTTASRRALLASGGETTLTGIGGAPLLGGQTNSPTLI